MLNTPNVQLHIVESSYGDRHHEVTSSTNSNHLQLNTNSEIWAKESMINLGVNHLLPKDWKYLAWLDCDISFRNPGWALETLHQLQHFPVVQPWQNCIDLGYAGNVNTVFDSFGYVLQQGQRPQRNCHEPYRFGHSGFAWACRRDFWENTKGLLDTAILGSSDHHMCFGMINDVQSTIHGKMSKPFGDSCVAWQTKAYQITQGQVGFTTGRIEHFYHGKKKNRKYRERWDILTKHKFDPFIDLRYDHQGLIQLVGKPQLEHDIHLYNLVRQEDALEDY